MANEQERKAEVLRFTDALRSACVGAVLVSYSGDGDEGRAEPPQFQDSVGTTLDEATLPSDVDARKLGELLESFAPEGYEDGEGGHGTVTFDVQAGKICIEHNWYELVSNPADPREI